MFRGNLQPLHPCKGFFLFEEKKIHENGKGLLVWEDKGRQWQPLGARLGELSVAHRQDLGWCRYLNLWSVHPCREFYGSIIGLGWCRSLFELPFLKYLFPDICLKFEISERCRLQYSVGSVWQISGIKLKTCPKTHLWPWENTTTKGINHTLCVSSIFQRCHVSEGHCLSPRNIYIKYANEIKEGSVREMIPPSSESLMTSPAVPGKSPTNLGMLATMKSD